VNDREGTELPNGIIWRWSDDSGHLFWSFESTPQAYDGFADSLIQNLYDGHMSIAIPKSGVPSFSITENGRRYVEQMPHDEETKP
jgi:hypothetical protein